MFNKRVWKKSLGILLTATLVLTPNVSVKADDVSVVTPVTQEHVWEFDTDGDFEGWNMAKHLEGTVSGGILTVKETGTDPQLVSDGGLNISSDYKYLTIKMKNNTSVANGIVYFSNAGESKFSGDKMLSFTSNANDSGYTTYVIDMSECEKWTGTIDKLRIDITEGASIGKTIEIDKIGIYKNASHTVKLNAGEGGTVTPKGETSIDLGKEFTFSAVPESGYVVDTVVAASGQTITENPDGTYTLPDIWKDDEITVSFTKQQPGEYVWEFDTDGDFEGWNMAKHLEGTVSGGILTVKETGTDPQLVSDGGLNISSDYKYLTIKMKNNTSVANGIVYFSNAGESKFSGDKMLSFTSNANDSGYTTYVIDMSECEKWTGTIDKLRIDITEGASIGKTIEIDKIGIYKNASHTVKLNAGEGGTVTPEGETSIDLGKDFTFSAVPESGYVVDTVVAASGQTITENPDGTYALPDIWKDDEITVSFTKQQPGECVWEFDTDGDFEGWNMTSNVTGVVANGVLTVTETGNDPYIMLEDNLNIPADYRYVVIKMKNNTKLIKGGVYFTTASEPSLSGDKNVSFPLKANDSGYTTYIVDMAQCPKWTGTIGKIRIDITEGGNLNKTLDIERISVVKEVNAKKIKIECNNTDWGTCSPLGEQYVEPGESMLLSVQPYGKYRINSVTSEQGHTISLENSQYVIQDVSQDDTIHIEFEEKDTPYYWDFEVNDNLEGWVLAKNLTGTNKDSVLYLQQTGGDAYVYSPGKLDMPAEQYQYMIIKMKNKTSDSTGAVYFTRNDSPSYDGNKRVTFFGVAKDTRFTNTVVDLSACEEWKDTIKSFRIDLMEGASVDGQIEIDSIRLCKASDIVKVSLASIGGGNAVPQIDQAVIKGEDLEFEAAPNTGYVVDSITTQSGKEVITCEDGTYLLKDVQEDDKITIKFAAKTSIATSLDEGLLEKESSELLIPESIFVENSTQLTAAPWDQMKVLTYNGFQYTVYFTSEGKLGIARINCETKEVQKIVFPYVTEDSSDGHRCPVIGYSPIDGRLHVAFDHHNNELNYIRTYAGFLDNPPEQISTDDFGPKEHMGSPAEEMDVSYPSFFNTAEGELYCTYRNGQSGNGDVFLERYNSKDGTWTMIGLLFERHGNYEELNTNLRSAYDNSYHFDKNNRLHVTWCWREQNGASPVILSNHDLNYAYSDDYGVTWKNNNGDIIADLSKNDPIDITDDTVAVRISAHQALMNQGASMLDSKGQLHVFLYYSLTNAYNETLNCDEEISTNYHFMHLWRDNTTGEWIEQNIDDTNNIIHGAFTLARGEMMVGPDDTVYAFCRANRVMYLAEASAEDNWSDWKLYCLDNTESSARPGRGDRVRLAEDGTLQLYITTTNSDVYIKTYVPVGENLPSKPELRSATSFDGINEIEWRPTVGATSYNIYRKEGNGKFIKIAENECYNSLKLTYTDNDVKEGIKYTYYITGLNSNGESVPSNELSTITKKTYNFEFNELQNRDGWHTDYYYDSAQLGYYVASESSIFSTLDLNLSTENNRITVAVNNVNKLTSATVSWVTDKDAEFNNAKSSEMDFEFNSEGDSYFTIDLSSNPNWKDTVTQVKITFAGLSYSSQVLCNYIRFDSADNPFVEETVPTDPTVPTVPTDPTNPAAPDMEEAAAQKGLESITVKNQGEAVVLSGLQKNRTGFGLLLPDSIYWNKYKKPLDQIQKSDNKTVVEIQYKSDNEAVIKVTKYGVIVPMSVGTANVTAKVTAEDGETRTFTRQFIVKDLEAVFHQRNVSQTLQVGKRCGFGVYLPENYKLVFDFTKASLSKLTENQIPVRIKYYSLDPSIVSVSKTGMVKANKKGTATVGALVTLKNGEFVRYYKTVTVK